MRCRKCMDSKCTNNNSSDWSRSAVISMGYGAVGMDHWHSHYDSICGSHSLQFQSLADCYRSPDPITGMRNCSYMDAVKTILGGKMCLVCGIVQYSNLACLAIGYTTTTSISMVYVGSIPFLF